VSESERDTRRLLLHHLAEAHAIEEQGLAELRSALEAAGDERLVRVLGGHLLETGVHERLVRDRLRALGHSPSRLQDLIRAVGGRGFVAFDRTQAESAAGLAAHAYFYEHLEIAAYGELARIARRAGDTETEGIAERILGDEERTAQRLHGVLDETARAAVAACGTGELRAHLVAHLSAAHARERQSVDLLRRAAEIARGRHLEATLAAHLEESGGHLRAVARRMAELGAAPTTDDAGEGSGAGVWAAGIERHPDARGKAATVAYAFEHLEIGRYEQLARVAELVGDRDTAALACEILAEERAAAEAIASEWEAPAPALAEVHAV
jgi:ferritin-like metal-binding protein YciE